MERQRAPPKGREAKNGSRGIDIRGRIPERLYRCCGRYAQKKETAAGNSIPVPIFESMFRKILLGETAESEV